MVKSQKYLDSIPEQVEDDFRLKKKNYRCVSIKLLSVPHGRGQKVIKRRSWLTSNESKELL